MTQTFEPAGPWIPANHQVALIQNALRNARPQRRKPISQWVENALVVPTGPYKGEPYRHSRHPASAHWFAALESNRWNRHAATAPTQNGKTLMCYTAPILYHLFEAQETVIVGIPTMDMANDKWAQDLLPAIEASRYASLLPSTGEGSRGGAVKRAITFRNGVTLRFMSAGGGDKKRAGYTARVLAITETDGMDEAGGASREADKIEQLEGRTRAYGATKRLYLECTASIERGRIWQELTRGTDSRLYRPCPYCRRYVCPEREHLVGWQAAKTELEAGEKSHWVCPACNHPWTEADRRSSAAAAVLVHRGQSARDSGEIVGPPPETATFGFRWSAIDNPFAETAQLGAEEWTATRSSDPENAERKQRQFVWALPYEPPDIALTPLDTAQVEANLGVLKRGVVPAELLGVTVGVDTGKRALHWVAIAWTAAGAGHIIEYGAQTVDCQTKGTARGLAEALAELASYLDAGWRSDRGPLVRPAQIWVDSGYFEHQQPVYDFCRAANAGLRTGAERYRPTKGYGDGQRGTGRYLAPKATGAEIRLIGLGYHLAWVRRDRLFLVHINADHWKSTLHQRLHPESDDASSITLYAAADPAEHHEFAAQITAERQVEKWSDARGATPVWERVRRQNHYLDAAYSATAAGHLLQTLAATPKGPFAIGAKPTGAAPKKGWFDR